MPVLTDLPRLLEIAERAESDGAGCEELKWLLQAGSSLGAEARVVDGAGHIATAKFPSPSSNTWNVMAWESGAQPGT